jgi:flagellar FliL protein
VPDGQVNENEAVTVEVKDAGSDESTDESKKSAPTITLKSILVLIVIGVIAVGSAFIFVTRVHSSKDAYSVANPDDASTVAKEDLKADTENMEVSEKKKSESKDEKKDSNKSDNGNQESNSALGKILVPLESIVVNLGKVDSKRYLRVIISLEVSSGETEQTVKDNKVIFRDKLISYLSSKSLNEISTQDSQFKLRTDIKDILNGEILGSDNAITQVYFSDFIIQ